MRCLIFYPKMGVVSRLEEEGEKYHLEIPEEVYQEHDKIFKTILQRPKEAEYVIKKALGLRKNRKLELEMVGNEYITRDFRGKRLDVLYKLKNKEVYFEIEHQTTQDPNMSYRILEYEVEVIRSSFLRNRKFKTYARVIAIVIYTGEGEWKAEQSIVEEQEKFGRKLEGRKDYMGIGEYNLIDINNYTKEELLEEGMLISKIMLIEKAKGEEELIEILDKIIPITKEEEKGIIIEILSYILVRELGREKSEKYIKMLEGDGDMLAVVERLKKDREKTIKDAREEGKKEGIIEGIIQTARNMLKERIDINTIERITKLNRKQFM